MDISTFPIVCRTGGLSTSVYFYAKRAIYMILQVYMILRVLHASAGCSLSDISVILSPEIKSETHTGNGVYMNHEYQPPALF